MIILSAVKREHIDTDLIAITHLTLLILMLLHHQLGRRRLAAHHPLMMLNTAKVVCGRVLSEKI